MLCYQGSAEKARELQSRYKVQGYRPTREARCAWYSRANCNTQGGTDVAYCSLEWRLVLSWRASVQQRLVLRQRAASRTVPVHRSVLKTGYGSMEALLQKLQEAEAKAQSALERNLGAHAVTRGVEEGQAEKEGREGRESGLEQRVRELEQELASERERERESEGERAGERAREGAGEAAQGEEEEEEGAEGEEGEGAGSRRMRDLRSPPSGLDLQPPGPRLRLGSPGPWPGPLFLLSSSSGRSNTHKCVGAARFAILPQACGLLHLDIVTASVHFRPTFGMLHLTSRCLHGVCSRGSVHPGPRNLRSPPPNSREGLRVRREEVEEEKEEAENEEAAREEEDERERELEAEAEERQREVERERGARREAEEKVQELEERLGQVVTLRSVRYTRCKHHLASVLTQRVVSAPTIVCPVLTSGIGLYQSRERVERLGEQLKETAEASAMQCPALGPCDAVFQDEARLGYAMPDISALPVSEKASKLDKELKDTRVKVDPAAQFRYRDRYAAHCLLCRCRDMRQVYYAVCGPAIRHTFSIRGSVRRWVVRYCDAIRIRYAMSDTGIGEACAMSSTSGTEAGYTGTRQRRRSGYYEHAGMSLIRYPPTPYALSGTDIGCDDEYSASAMSCLGRLCCYALRTPYPVQTKAMLRRATE
eukprot:1197138-Rhodomonas_salina.4